MFVVERIPRALDTFASNVSDIRKGATA